MSDADKIRFHYLKADGYRDCHCDGIYGGPTPNGQLWAGFFSERGPVPREAVHQLLPVDSDPTKHKLGDMIPGDSVVKDGIVRTLQCGIHLNLATALHLREWLEKQISILESQP